MQSRDIRIKVSALKIKMSAKNRVSLLQISISPESRGRLREKTVPDRAKRYKKEPREQKK